MILQSACWPIPCIMVSMPTRTDSTAPLKVVCAWCGLCLRNGPPTPISHGICPKCLEQELNEVSKYDYQDPGQDSAYCNGLSKEPEQADCLWCGGSIQFT